ncbi:stalk domain-containing protein [Paenibacillus faecalis]|uniref:stalk domain-containing protein n=1 Tax=Paenibacillus faecalis TaxID=2079532 RepID=UPI000D0F7889|nr:stalk domain-containing protein [Paenibacillus faecalis]
MKMKKMVIGLTLGMLISSSTVAFAATSPTVKATLVKYKMMVNGEPKSVSSNQLSYKGNTYIQLREAASLFGYKTKFDGPNKTIHFTHQDQEWISLAEFSEISNLKVEADKEKKDVYHVIKGKDTILTLNARDLNENEERGVASQSGIVIYSTKIKGSLMLNTEDLKAAGLL